MAWSIYQFHAVDETGTVIPGAIVTVRDSVDALAMIASDDTGTAKTNPFAADDAGYAFFFAQSGTYKIEVTVGGNTQVYANVPIGSARGADIGDGAHQLRLNEDNDDRFIIRTQAPIEVTADATAQPEWTGRIIRVTAAANITVADTADTGFTFDVQRATTDAVGFLLDGADVFEPSFGSGAGVTAIVISEVNGWASVYKPAAGIIAVVGQIVDGTPT